jgi:hypothetical protein
MSQIKAYYMNPGNCTYLKEKPELYKDVSEALAGYVADCENAKNKRLGELFTDCENARKKLDKRMDEIFKEFHDH